MRVFVYIIHDYWDFYFTLFINLTALSRRIKKGLFNCQRLLFYNDIFI